MGTKDRGRGSKGKGKGIARDTPTEWQRSANSAAKQLGSHGVSSTGGGRGKGSSELPRYLDALSRELVQLLRHQGLRELRSDGFAPLSAVVTALHSQPSSNQVEAVVLLSLKDGVARFELIEENGEKWIRAREKHSLYAVEIARARPEVTAGTGSATDWLGSASDLDLQQPPECPEHLQTDEIGHAIHDFDASSFGVDYISVQRGEVLTLRKDVSEDTGWAYGQNCRGSGWFPARIFRPSETFDCRHPVLTAPKAKPAFAPKAQAPAIVSPAFQLVPGSSAAPEKEVPAVAEMQEICPASRLAQRPKKSFSKLTRKCVDFAGDFDPEKHVPPQLQVHGDDDLANDPTTARARILQLEAELAREKSITASLRQEVDQLKNCLGRLQVNRS